MVGPDVFISWFFQVLSAVSEPFGFMWRKDFSKTLFEYYGAKFIIISGPNPLNYESYKKLCLVSKI